MKKIVGLLCLLMLSTAVFADMTKAQLQQMYMDYLKSQGISAEIDPDGDIEFKYSGAHFNNLTYWIFVNEMDQEFFRVAKVGGYSLDTDQEKSKAPLAASYATRETYVAKVYVQQSGNNITASAETFIASPQDFKVVFPKLIRELDAVLSRFLNQMQ